MKEKNGKSGNQENQSLKDYNVVHATDHKGAVQARFDVFRLVGVTAVFSMRFFKMAKGWE